MRWWTGLALICSLSACTEPATYEYDGVQQAWVRDFACPPYSIATDTLVVIGTANRGSYKCELSHVDAERTAAGVDLRVYVHVWKWVGDITMPPTELGCEFGWQGEPPWSDDSVQVRFMQPNGTFESCTVLGPGGKR